MKKEKQIQLDHAGMKANLKERRITYQSIGNRLWRTKGTVSKALNGVPGYYATLSRIHKYYFKPGEFVINNKAA